MDEMCEILNNANERMDSFETIIDTKVKTLEVKMKRLLKRMKYVWGKGSTLFKMK